jgi:hypothetical protein
MPTTWLMFGAESVDKLARQVQLLVAEFEVPVK